MLEYSNANITAWTRLGMRKSFGKMMFELAEDKPNFMIVAADMANSGNLLEFAEKYPDRFLNVGVAEQNMAGIAAGLAKEGNRVFIVSFAPFVAMRAYEAIRTLLGYMHLDVKIIALSSGLSLGFQGNTHYCMEDLALMRLIPGMAVLSPADCVEEAKCLEYLCDHQGPAYLRLTGIDGTPGIHKKESVLTPGEPEILREGSDLALIATGSVTNECVRAARALKQHNLDCTVVNVPFIKPLRDEPIIQLCQRHRLVVSVEEHYAVGGLGGAIAEILATEKDCAPLLRIGIKDEFPTEGNYSELLDRCGLTAPRILERVLSVLG